ncbi:MAG: aldehyde dehydrogenase family protein [Nevskiaceae bacterium]|nr:MAG: aldehyde dehydrogenase family protein [Nevskiaceae bacterium]TBR73273.1 MAG: aldehyde dehydrogenase family protein [Nevskiaceae bacterium]
MRSEADLILTRAKWASEIFRGYDRERTQAIVQAVAQAAFEKAQEYAEWAVRETGFGVVEHKRFKAEASSRGLVEYYRDHDFVNPRVDHERMIVEIPRPAGVVFALAPATNPIATVYFKILSALMTRNAIVFSAHPASRECCNHATRLLAEVAERAGAPDGVIQAIDEPTIPLIDEFMRSDKTSVILATGGMAMVRAAYSSSNPALGVGPGNGPIVVDDTGDCKKTARYLVDSKSFDNGILCTADSIAIVYRSIAKQLRIEMERVGAYFCKEDEISLLREFMFGAGSLNVKGVVGRDAPLIARDAGIRVPLRTRILVAPIKKIGIDEPLSKEKLSPVLAWFVAAGKSEAFTQARATLRMTGAGHSAAIHSSDPQTVLDYATSVEAYRVIANTALSQGASGLTTNLAPTMTVGTGFFGRSSVGENVGPMHLVHWTRIAYAKDASIDISSFDGKQLKFSGPLASAPSDGVPGEDSGSRAAPPAEPRAPVSPGNRRQAGKGRPVEEHTEVDLRSEIRRLIAEELRRNRGE